MVGYRLNDVVACTYRTRCFGQSYEARLLPHISSNFSDICRELFHFHTVLGAERISTGGPPCAFFKMVDRLKNLRSVNPIWATPLKTKLALKMEGACIESATQEVLKPFFNCFWRVKTRYDIKPCNWCNMDESGLALGGCSNSTAVGTEAAKVALSKTPSNREWVSTIDYIFALGCKIIPLIIFKGQSIQSSWFNNDEIPDMAYTHSWKG